MAHSLGNKLDAGETFPDFEWNFVNGEKKKISQITNGQWSAVLLYRGHW